MGMPDFDKRDKELIYNHKSTTEDKTMPAKRKTKTARKSPAPRKPKLKTARQMVEDIEAWAKKHDTYFEPTSEPAKLWRILTALRGPDQEDSGIKGPTTEVIRGWLVPELTRQGGGLARITDLTQDAIINMQYELNIQARGDLSTAHFRHHIRGCLDAITWAPVGPPKEKAE